MKSIWCLHLQVPWKYCHIHICSVDPGPVSPAHQREMRVQQKHGTHDLEDASEGWWEKFPGIPFRRKLVFAECLLTTQLASSEGMNHVFSLFSDPGGRNPYTYFAGEKTEGTVRLNDSPKATRIVVLAEGDWTQVTDILQSRAHQSVLLIWITSGLG